MLLVDVVRKPRLASKSGTAKISVGQKRKYHAKPQTPTELPATQQRCRAHSTSNPRPTILQKSLSRPPHLLSSNRRHHELKTPRPTSPTHQPPINPPTSSTPSPHGTFNPVHLSPRFRLHLHAQTPHSRSSRGKSA